MGAKDTGSNQGIWARLRAYCAANSSDGQDQYYGLPVYCPPATEGQLQRTEEQLGFPLPAELRRLYAEVANGGRNLGPVRSLHGAEGGCPAGGNARDRSHTIGTLVSRSGWRFHPRLEEALARHPERYVVVDTSPQDFLALADAGGTLRFELDGRTGGVYLAEDAAEIPDESEATVASTEDAPSIRLHTLRLVSPTLSEWFARWLELADTEFECGPLDPYPREVGPLTPALVETTDLSNPQTVWRGVYRLGPGWLRPGEEEPEQR